MEIVIQKLDKDLLIKLSGRLDMNTSPDLRKAALTLRTRGRCNILKVDLAEVPFIDTAGLATLLEVLVATNQQRTQLILSGLNENVRYLIDVNGLAGFFMLDAVPEERSHL